MASIDSLTASLTSNNRSEWEHPDFWRKICPELTIEAAKQQPVANNDDAAPSTATETVATATNAKDRRSRLIERGYALVDEPVADPLLIQSLRHGVETLHKLGLPASFILLFDATWELAALSRSMLSKSTASSNRFHYDILAWCIESGGFSPHRDRQPEGNALADSFTENNEAKFVTQWIALTDATPQNSCLYMIPRDSDPGYMHGDTEEHDPLTRALPNKQAFQEIKCFPRQLGQSVLFTHRIIHWGSTRDAATKEPPRIAISFVCSDPQFEKPYVDPSYFTGAEKTPPFRIRMLLVCAQLLIYYQRFNLPKACIKACYDYCKDHEDELEETYRHKVFVEFCKAMNETNGVAADSAKDSVGNGVAADSKPRAKEDGDESQDEEAEEAMMEEMLNAENGGYGEFEDDYDELEEEAGEGDFGAVNGDGIESDEDDEDDLDGVGLFGKRNGDSTEQDATPASKRAKPSIK